MKILRTQFIIFLAMLVLASPFAEAVPLINVPLKSDFSDFNRETYRFIHRLLNKRVLSGISRGSLPLTRKQVVSYLLEVYEKQENGEITLSTIDQERLNALLAFYREVREFSKPTAENGSEATTQIPHSGRLHVGTIAGENYRFSLDFGASQRAITHLVDNLSDEQPVEGNMLGYHLPFHTFMDSQGRLLHLRRKSAYRSIYGEIFDDLFPDESKHRQAEGKLKNRVAINAYMKFNLPWFELQLGQDTLQWGPGYHDSLLISKNPLAMNMIKLKAAYKPITFTAFTAILEDMAPDINDKYISGHRLEGYFWDRFGVRLL